MDDEQLTARHAEWVKARKKALGGVNGLLQTFGAVTLVLMEFTRNWLQDVAEALKDETPARAAAAMQGNADFRDFMRSSADWGDDGLGKLAADLLHAISLDQSRAALWTAVFIAVVVRLNLYGPPGVQAVLSGVASVYCLLATVAGLPLYGAGGGDTFGAIAFCAVMLWACTRNAKKPSGGGGGGSGTAAPAATQ
jgi:hypothetical protein